MVNKQFEELKVSGKLPSPTGVGLELLKLAENDDASAQEIAQVVQRDPALTGRILQLANSAVAGSSVPVTTVSDATVRLGVKAVQSLALGFSVVSGNRMGSCPGFDYDLFWSESLARAAIARVFASRLKCGTPSEAFVCGLLSDVGRLALATVHQDAYAQLLLDYSGPNRRKLCELEQERFGINHAEVSGAMLEEWKLPKDFAYGAREMWLPANRDSDAVPSMRILMRAIVRMAASFVAESDVPVDREVFDGVLRNFKLWSDEDMPEIWDEAVLEWGQWGGLMDVTTGRVPRYEAEGGDNASLDGTQSEGGCRVMIISSDQERLQASAAHLRSVGHTVTVGSDGEAALQTIVDVAPQVVIADRHLPGRDGLELCRIVRQADLGQEICFQVVSETNDEEDILAAFDAGVDEYLVLPLPLRLLAARVHAVQRLIRLQVQVDADKKTMQEQVAELSILTRKLRDMAVTDALTGLPNRRFAMEQLGRAWTEASESGQGMAFIMIDIDHFKGFNDTYGHDVGDEVLRSTARTLRTHVREDGEVCRLGGEEFCVLISTADANTAAAIAERCRAAVEAAVVDLGEKEGTVNVSLGVALRTPDMTHFDELMKAADEALYQAKDTGRNRVVNAWDLQGSGKLEPVA